MPRYVYEFIHPEQNFYQIFLIDFEITSWGSPASFMEPGDPVEFEVTEVCRLHYVIKQELDLLPQLPFEERPSVYFMERVRPFYESTELTTHQMAFYALQMGKSFADIIDENWDPEWGIPDDDFFD